MGIRTRQTWILTLAVCFLVCLTHGLPPRSEKKGKALEAESIDRFKQFDWNVTKAVGSRVKNNVLLSPISLKLVLAMLYEGAGGETAKELKEALNIQNTTSEASQYTSLLQTLQSSTSGYDLHVGMKLFIDHHAKPKKDFAKKIHDLYNATIQEIDFSNTSAAVTQINSWAKSVTRGHIEHLVSEADTKSSTVLLLLNAVYFSGLWKNPFPLNNTHDGKFNVSPDKQVDVKYMATETTFKYAESQELQAQIIRLPYMGDKFAMYIVLPDEDTNIDSMMKKMTPAKIRSDLAQMMDVQLLISLPKFSFEFASSLAPVLSEIGIKEIFSNGADLRNIAEGPKDLVVSNVIQKASIDVHEQGTVASAVTAIELVNKFGMHTFAINVTRPFAFFIQEETTETVIFVGKVMNPGDPGKSKVNMTPESVAAAPPAAQPTAQPPQNPTTPVIVVAETLGNRISDTLPSNPFYYFDIKLPQKIYGSGYSERNWVTSPASIKTALGLLLEGASKKTAAEICESLRLPQDIAAARNEMYTFQTNIKKPSHGVEVKVANKIAVNKNINLKRNSKLNSSTNYGSIISPYDFTKPVILSKELNSWVSEQTNNYIKEIINPGDISSSSGLLLLNAIYFKGEWMYGFNTQHTRHGCFYIPQCNQVQMMRTTGTFKHGDVNSLHSQIIELPYKDPRYSMIIVVPYDMSNFKRMIEDLPFNYIPSILSSMVPTEVEVLLPKFTINFSIDLIPILKKLGINDLFTENADLSDFISTKAKVSGFIHKAKIEVNEKGTVAGAATVANVQLLSSDDRNRFEINRPFFFFVRDSESGFLFDGQVMNPRAIQVMNSEETSEENLLLKLFPVEDLENSSLILTHSETSNAGLSDQLKEEGPQLERERLNLEHGEEMIQLQIDERRKKIEFELEQLRRNLELELEEKRQRLKLRERHYQEKLALEKKLKTVKT